jgi:hypothetical protein
MTIRIEDMLAKGTRVGFNSDISNLMMAKIE